MNTEGMKMNSAKSAPLVRIGLDLGSWNGRGSDAYRHMVDKWIFIDNEQYKQYDGWRTVNFSPETDYRIMDIMDYHEPAEIVVCYDVLYHVPDPHALLKHLRKLTKERLYLRTWVFDGDGWVDKHNDKTVSNHAPTRETIYYYPTIKGLVEELMKVGFIVIKTIGEKNHVLFVCEPVPRSL